MTYREGCLGKYLRNHPPDILKSSWKIDREGEGSIKHLFQSADKFLQSTKNTNEILDANSCFIEKIPKFLLQECL
jgi:hypothetical protein